MTCAFPNGIKHLASLVRDAVLDIPALSRPITACELSNCRGTCCHDGVYLTGEEANVIRDLADSEAVTLASLGATLPERVVVYGNFRDIASGPKTATRPAPMKQWVSDYPEHFAETNCVFLLSDSRCALQALAMEQGRDPWHFKPFTCWIHPLSFTTNFEGHNLLTLYSEENDPHRFDDYPGFTSKTHCGRLCDSPGSRPAYQILDAELKRLGAIGGRDLVEEIRSQVE